MFNNNLLNKIISPFHAIDLLKIEQNSWTEGQAKICYVGLGAIGMEIGNKLSGYCKIPIQKLNPHSYNGYLFSLFFSSWQDILDKHLDKQDLVVIVSDIEAPLFLELRKFIISRASSLWTICMISDTAKDDILGMHYAPNEILRINQGSIFPYRDVESFLESIMAMYHVQNSYKNNKDRNRIFVEAMEDLGI